MGSGAGGGGFRYVENCWITTSDGVRLAATLWLPAAASETAKVPAVLEIVPYRKRDHTAARDFQNHSYLAAKGFAGCRVDMRGSGDSEGAFDAHKTYDDVIEILRWLGEQPWCSGKLGMFGLSWGGINAIMAADRHAAGLKAVVASSFSSDRLSDGMLWKNGCILNRNFVWATAVAGLCSRPPDPAIIGDSWRDLWMRRLETLQPEIANYLGHQRRDAYWDKHRIADAKGISCPLYITGGWADSNYTQTLPKLLNSVAGPRRAVFGPWGHRYPHQAMPGPATDFLGEAVRWFGHWLRGDDNGADREPAVHAFIAEDLPTQTFYATTPGRWIAETKWPIASDTRTYFLGQGSLQGRPPAPSQCTFSSPQTAGLCSGELMPWFAYAPGPELPGDQRPDDGQSLCFDTEPLEQDLLTLGAPALDLEFSVDKPAAFLAIRICDVKPDGSSARVNLGLHNLTRVAGDREPVALEPGRRYRLALPLDFKGYTFKAGHRIRLAISTTYWPMVWPSPSPVTLTVYRGHSRLELPVRKPTAREAAVTLRSDPAVGSSLRRTEVIPPERRRWVTHDEVTGETVLTVADNNGRYRLDDIDWEVSSATEEVYRITGNDPLTARMSMRASWAYERGPLKLRTETRSELRASKDAFTCDLSIEAFEGDTSVWSRRWSYDMPRDLV